jgi:sodium transport system permease protein
MRGALLICKKEFLELSKDKRTLFFTFFVPILLYPLVFFMIAGLGQHDAAGRLGRPSRISILDPDQVLEPRLREAGEPFQLFDQPPGAVRQALKEHNLDLVVEVERGAKQKLERQEPFVLRVLVDRTEASSELALERLREAVRKLDEERVQQRLQALHAPPRLTQPSRLDTENIAEAGLAAGKALGAFLPYVLMLMMFQGAMQHGIYVTAGEKERGTLQTLLATRLPRNQIILGKLIYIFAMGLLAALLNLASMGISLALVMGRAGTQRVEASIGAAGNLSAMTRPGTLFLCFLLLVPLGLLFSSFILFMGVRARNTAEAGTSLMPGLFLIVLLGAFSLAPGLERMPFLPYVPILNVSLAIRNLFSQQGHFAHYLVALFMTSGLSALMTWASAHLLDQESVLFKQS